MSIKHFADFTCARGNILVDASKIVAIRPPLTVNDKLPGGATYKKTLHAELFISGLGKPIEVNDSINNLLKKIDEALNGYSDDTQI